MRLAMFVILLLALIISHSPAHAQDRTELKSVTIRYYARVTQASVSKLLNTVDAKLQEGYKQFVLLISSPGGDVSAGLTAYNYLKGIPAEIITHNFGAVDSIAAVIYCAGTKRYMVPEGRFVLHPVNLRISSMLLFGKRVLSEERSIFLLF